MLSKLDVKLRTPAPPAPEDTLWEAKTPSNAREIEAQLTLIRDRVQRHKSFSPASIVEAVNQLTRSSPIIAHEVVLIRKEMAEYR